MKFYNHRVTQSFKMKISKYSSVKLGVLCGKYYLYLLVMFFLVFGSCVRSAPEDSSGLVTWSGAVPLVFLQAGEHPLWFQLTEDGPVHIESIEDIVFTNALVPWPLALHISFLQETNDGIIMAVNRFGFLKLAVMRDRLALYSFSGNEVFRQNTVGGFTFFNGYPLAVLYLDDRFLQSDVGTPSPRVWTFNMNSNIPFPMDIPSFTLFPEDEGWNIDILWLAYDGLIYYRAVRRIGASGEIKMFRTSTLSQIGEEISAETFFYSSLRQDVISHPSLPVLPEGFIYTGIGRIGTNLFASWEEQSDFNIGAAGFVVIRPY